MKNRLFCLMIALLFACPSVAKADDGDTKDPLEGLKCFMMPKRDVKGKKEMEYKGATLYLCCSTCIKRMTRTPEKYEAKANHQLVQTAQFVQAACPIDGSAVSDASPTLEIAGAKVKFSSEDHKAKVAAMEVEEQIEKIFGAEPFKKGKFALKKKSDS
ncbi:MAG: hypothetical protein AAGG48_10635 [Planctomycetota bacterium]